MDVRNTTDPGAQCDADGGFEPTQCRRRRSGSSFRCYCVQPGGDGAPISGTEVFVNDTDNTLDCDDLGIQKITIQCALMYHLHHKMSSNLSYIHLLSHLTHSIRALRV